MYADSGNAGDPFPGTANNSTFDAASNPSSLSYDYEDTFVSLTKISKSSNLMTFDLTVKQKSISPVYQGEGNIGGYDTRSTQDLAFALDADGTCSLDHLCLYRPGTGKIWILKRHPRRGFIPIYLQDEGGSGIGGFDLKSPKDRAFAFDYEQSGRMEHIVLYRPGDGVVFIVKRNKATGGWVPVFRSWKGIDKFDLKQEQDHVFAFDFNGDGRQDHLVFYRAGSGACYIVRKTGGTPDGSIVVWGTVWFSPNTYAPYGGIGGFDIKKTTDRAFAIDWESSGRKDHIAWIRPAETPYAAPVRKGIFSVVKPRGANKDFVTVYSSGATGDVGGYELSSPADVAFAFDWDRSGRDDHVVFYRPGRGPMWIMKRLPGSKTLEPVYAVGPGNGIGGYDLKSPTDKLFAYDYDHVGKADHLVAYRTDGSGKIWILKHGG